MTEDRTSNIPAYSVTDIQSAVRQTLEGRFDHVRIRGEVSRPTYHSSGHIYLTLKDSQAVIDAVVWRFKAAHLPLRLEEGLDIIATGKISSYAGSSRIQLLIETVELAGEGALLKQLEERKKRLSQEGLFAPERKKKIPFLPERIGVISSPTGAVIQDILHRIKDRFPRDVLLWPVRVQGKGADVEIARAIEGFNALSLDDPLRPTVLIIARGGGSLEDLWTFNEETVVRAAAASEIPIISAIGHETDTTLLDYVADERAPTPTAAAEKAVPVRYDLLNTLRESQTRQEQALRRLFKEKHLSITSAARTLSSPLRTLLERQQKFDHLCTAFEQSQTLFLTRKRALLNRISLPKPQQFLSLAEQKLRTIEAGLPSAPYFLLRKKDPLSLLKQRFLLIKPHLLDKKTADLKNTLQLLQAYSYHSTLERGFARIASSSDTTLSSVKEVHTGDNVRLEFHDGSCQAEILGPTEGSKKRKAHTSKQKKEASNETSSKSPKKKQGTLF